MKDTGVECEFDLSIGKTISKNEATVPFYIAEFNSTYFN